MKTVVLVLMLTMTLMLPRILEMIFFFPSENFDLLLWILWMGFRFDMLVIGFLLFVILLLPMRKKEAFMVSWFLIGGYYVFNSWGFAERREHLWLQDFWSYLQTFEGSHYLYRILALFVGVLMIKLGLLVFRNIENNFKDLNWKQKGFLFLILALMARGSLLEDHLRRNHCDGQPNKTLRSFCMNPLYTFAKLRNQEFGP